MKILVALLSLFLAVPTVVRAQDPDPSAPLAVAKDPMTAEEFAKLAAAIEKSREKDPEAFIRNTRTVLLAKTGMADTPGFPELLLLDAEYNMILAMSGYSSAGDFALPEKYLVRFVNLTSALTKGADLDRQKCLAIVLATVVGEAQRLKDAAQLNQSK